RQEGVVRHGRQDQRRRAEEQRQSGSLGRVGGRRPQVLRADAGRGAERQAASPYPFKEMDQAAPSPSAFSAAGSGRATSLPGSSLIRPEVLNWVKTRLTVSIVRPR